MTAVFIGHGECYGLTKERIKSEVIKAINSGVTEFLNGGQGSFDWIAASAVHDLKKDYPDIKSYNPPLDNRKRTVTCTMRSLCVDDFDLGVTDIDFVVSFGQFNCPDPYECDFIIASITIQAALNIPLEVQAFCVCADWRVPTIDCFFLEL